jgi:hypothetical protein
MISIAESTIYQRRLVEGETETENETEKEWKADNY